MANIDCPKRTKPRLECYVDSTSSVSAHVLLGSYANYLEGGLGSRQGTCSNKSYDIDRVQRQRFYCDQLERIYAAENSLKEEIDKINRYKRLD